MDYLTFMAPPSGVFRSQVADVCRYTSMLQTRPTRLVSLLSMRGFLGSRSKIKATYPHTQVIPALPRLRNWKRNRFHLGLVLRALGTRSVLARGPVATVLALELRERGVLDRVGYDGRGAVAAEWNEYDVVPDPQLKADIESIERRAVLESDVRSAVSHALVDYWRDRFGYEGDDQVVIPCTLPDGFVDELPAEADVEARRTRLGFKPDDVVLVYSGSSAGWQSLDLLDRLVVPAMERDPRVAILMLTPRSPSETEVGRRFPDRVRTDWVAPRDVPGMLAIGDYGLLLREPSTTNQVAAPTKFAEYLACGLPVLMTNAIADYARFVHDHGCGLVLSGDSIDDTLEPTPRSTHESVRAIALERLTKDAFRPAYERLVSTLS